MMFSNLIINRFLPRNVKFVRFKHKESNLNQVKKKTGTYKTLEHFDDFYKQVYKSKWSEIRKALLSKQKYIAVVNNYSDSEETCKVLENRGAINIRKLFQVEAQNLKENHQKQQNKIQLEKVFKMDKDIQNRIDVEDAVKDFSLQKGLDEAEYDTSRIIYAGNAEAMGSLHEFIPATKIKGKEDFIPESEHFKFFPKTKEFPLQIEKEYDLHFPEHLNAYCYEEENHTDFPQPKKGSTGVYNYYLMDGGSLLPVLALGLKPGDRVLDMCSAPGGKSLIALQTLYPEVIVCNDSSVSRTNRVQRVLEQYLFDLDKKWFKTGKIKISCHDGRHMIGQEFDKILVDVPCTTDRHSVKEDENNIFRSDRIKERLKLPELQSELLFNALSLVNIGGVVVYSTCSLSPIQNDGVVHMSLKKIWEETKLEFIIKDLSVCLKQGKYVYKMAGPKLMRYGNLVLPSVGQNFGPTYFCKLERIKNLKLNGQSIYSFRIFS